MALLVVGSRKLARAPPRAMLWPPGGVRAGADAMSEADILRQVVERTRRVFPNAQRVMLFGSQARGDARADSDYDLLVVAPMAESARMRSVPLRLALRGLGASFDIVVLTPREFEELRASRGHLQPSMLREAKVLLDAA